MEQGIYFNLPYQQYRDALGLSYSGCKDLLVSKLYYWHNHINPDREPEDTAAQTIGKASHKFILEPDSFYEEFVVLPDDAPKKPTSAQVNAKKPSPQTTEDIAWWAEFNSKNEGKILLKKEQFADIEKAAKMLALYPGIKKYISGGYPEVSIFVLIGKVMHKCRIDYLSLETLDYKTFSNSQQKDINRAIHNTILYNCYNLQYYFYSKLREIARARLSKGAIKTYGGASEEFIDMLTKTENAPFSFIFQESCAPFEVRKITLEKALMEGATTNVYYSEARRLYERAHTRYAEGKEQFGLNPWVESNYESVLQDEDVPNIIYQSL